MQTFGVDVIGVMGIILICHAVSSHRSGPKFYSTFAGAYIPIFERAEDCAIGELGYDGSIRRHISYTRFNPYRRYDPQFVSGNMTFDLPYNDSYWVSVNLAVWSNNQWKDNAFVFNHSSAACSNIQKNVPEYFRNLHVAQTTGPCVIPAGLYKFPAVRVNIKIGKIPVLPYGQYRALRRSGIIGRKNFISECVYYVVRLLPD